MDLEKCNCGREYCFAFDADKQKSYTKKELIEIKKQIEEILKNPHQFYD